ncbi:uncharacterized protein LOC128239064 [Mya arenaria]|uniref:uncharacterized protein LOC128239064 n=1 Tax=Mya arenaria TaxID=6604 RepID=UPI0022E86718|nr:uncharacterized protein LOC128239064 [Mya arenaria]
MKTQTNYIKILHLLILSQMLAYLAPVTAAAAVLPPDEATCTVRVNQGSVVFKISSSDPKNIISIQAKGTYVADCDQDALLRQTNDTNAFLVSLTHSGACVFIINNYDGTIFSVKIESATSTLTEVSIGGEPFTDCFSPSFVDLNLIGEEKCHQQKLGTICKDEVPDWAKVMLVLETVVILIILASVLYRAPWRRCQRCEKDQNSSTHVKERSDSDGSDTCCAEPLQENGNTPHQQGKPGKERHDSNGAVKEECHANVEQEPIANNKNGKKRHDSFATYKNDRKMSPQKATHTKSGKQQIDRNATAKDGQRDKIAQQPFRMSTRKTQRSFGPSEPVLRNRFQVLVDPV